MLAYTGSTWTEVVISASIFVPVVVTIVLAVIFLRGSKHDPDLERLRRAQRDHDATRPR